jgi:hypothetical protein
MCCSVGEIAHGHWDERANSSLGGVFHLLCAYVRGEKSSAEKRHIDAESTIGLDRHRMGRLINMGVNQIKHIGSARCANCSVGYRHHDMSLLRRDHQESGKDLPVL